MQQLAVYHHLQRKKDFSLPASDEESRDEKIQETKYCALLAAA